MWVTVIAVIRLVLFWSALTLYVGHADTRQGAGYALLILNSVVELALAVAITGAHLGPMSLAAALIVVTSGVVGWLWAATRV